jgi:hypothetical protein
MLSKAEALMGYKLLSRDGEIGKGKESVSQCPMLKGMEEKAGEAQKEKK